MFERRETRLCWLVASAFYWAMVPALLVQAQGTAPPVQAAPQAANGVAQSVPEQAVGTEQAASDEQGAAPESDVTPERVQQRQEEIRQKLSALETSGLPEEDRKKAAEFYQKALDALTSLGEYRAQKDLHVRNSAAYADELDKFQKDLAAINSGPAAIDLEGDLATLEQRLATQEQVVQQAREKLAASEKQPKNRQTRLAEIPQLIVERQQELEKASARLALVETADPTDLVATAERIYQKARVDSLQMSLAEMEEQRKYFSKSPDLVQVRRDYRAKFLAQEEKKLAEVRDEIDRLRLAEAEKQATEAAETAAVERPKAIAELAQQNAELADKQAKIAAKNKALTDEKADVDKRRDNLANDYKQSLELFDAAGLSEASGQQLRQQQELLPDRSAISRRMALLATEKEEITYKLFELMDRRSTIVDADVDDRVAKILDQVPADQRDSYEQEVRDLLASELKILTTTMKAYDDYLNQLTALSVSEDQLRTTAREYAEYIAKNVLWIRSTSLPRLADLKPAAGAVAWSIDPQNWRAVLAALWTKSGSAPLVVALFVLVMALSIYMHRRSRSRLRAIGEKAAKRTSVDFWPSLEALWITLLLALPWPILLGFVGWWMDSPFNDSEFVRSLSVSLRFTALCLLLLELVRHLCRSGGLADAHFNWPQSCLAQVRRHVRGLIWICLPLVVWLVGLEIQNVEKLWSSSLGRACFIVVMLYLAFTAYRIVMSRTSPFRQLLNNSETASIRLFRFWAPLITALPVLLTLVAIIGYYYTAQQLSVHLLQTAGIVLVLLIVGGLTRRWILINRRRLAREQAKQKRDKAIAAATASVDSDEPPPLPPEVVEDSVDLVALGEQTSKLVFTVLVVAGVVSAWFVWAEMLPALSSLDGWQVIPHEVKVGDDIGFTWGHLLRFLLAVGTTVIAVRNIPALLEFAVLQHLPLDNGSRYAITSLCRYLLVAIGLTAAYTALGFDGTSIQWLVAAMGVGLGFGLQEIFANFVSGIILLFERPIRVGDIITLGEKTGVVSRIRMRATTMIDPDRKEYVVPNKDLVTERLLNWTLSDSVNRIEIRVGVAYGSDTELACQLLREAAAEHPLILKEPEPLATFDAFGDSTLNLILRCFLLGYEKRLPTISELNTAINNKFAAAGLEIAFPQTDLHVRSVPKEWLRADGPAPSNGSANGKEAAKTADDKLST